MYIHIYIDVNIYTLHTTLTQYMYPYRMRTVATCGVHCDLGQLGEQVELQPQQVQLTNLCV